MADTVLGSETIEMSKGKPFSQELHSQRKRQTHNEVTAVHRGRAQNRPSVYTSTGAQVSHSREWVGAGM